MRRRQYLITGVGLAMIGAGSGYGSADEEEEGEVVTCPPEEEFDVEDDSEPEIELHDHELVTIDDEISPEAYIEAEVENAGDAPSGEINLEVDWYDENDNYLDDGREWLQTLGPGETWRARVRHLGDSEGVADYELDIVVDDEVPTSPEGFVLEDSEMQVGDRSVDIEGTVANETGDEISFIEAIAIIYDEDCAVLGSDRTNELNVPEGETWAFDISWRGRDRIDEAAGYRIVLSD